MGKELVRLTRLNWDQEYLMDIYTNNGFTITEQAVFKTDEAKQKTLYGARSPLYGTNYEDETAFIERYRCQCGEFKGKLFEGRECPLCHTKVQQEDINIQYTGWISFGDNFIINPYWYNLIDKCLGGKGILDEITSAKTLVDVDGNFHIARPDEYDYKANHPYAGIGIIEFRKRFEEIMKYFKGIKPKKESEFNTIIGSSSSVFTSKIPVYSTFLRPQSITNDTYHYNSIDKQINPLFNLSEKIRDAEEIDKILILTQAQKRVNAMWKENFSLLNGKEGWIRGQILGGSLNYTSRNVIVPHPMLYDNEVYLSYHTFLDLFKFKIIYFLMKMKECTLAEAYYDWKRATVIFDERIYNVMQYIVEKKEPRVMINRNPTLNYYSMLLMKVAAVKRDYTDYTMSIPEPILPGLNADFDGDILNIIGMMSKELTYCFRKYDPVTRMIISRDTGKMNPYFDLVKEQLINVYHFATID